MKTGKELRMNLNQGVQELFRLFQKLADPNKDQEMVDKFIEVKDRINNILADIAYRENSLAELLKDPRRHATYNGSQDGDYVISIGEVIISKSGDMGLVCVAFIDGEIWVAEEFSYADERKKQMTVTEISGCNTSLPN